MTFPHPARLATLAASSVFLLALECPDPEPRPGDVYDGSAQWGWDLAEPDVTSFASDAVLYEILGAQVYRDGRLPDNTGSWAYVTWSASRAESFTVTVRSDGTFTTDSDARPTAPGSNSQPIPANWENSPVIFSAAEPLRPAVWISLRWRYSTWLRGMNLRNGGSTIPVST